MFVSVFICRLGHSDDGLCLPVALCSDWSFFLLDQVNTHTHTNTNTNTTTTANNNNNNSDNNDNNGCGGRMHRRCVCLPEALS